jgi:hypothetical protein
LVLALRRPAAFVDFAEAPDSVGMGHHTDRSRPGTVSMVTHQG